MRKTYQQPCLTVCQMQTEAYLLSASNQMDGNNIRFNQDTMQEGSGDDAAVKGQTYSIWDDAW